MIDELGQESAQESEIYITVSGDKRMAEHLRGWSLTTGITCPACGEGQLIWAENGFVPGYRLCSHCGRGWMAEPDKGRVRISIPEVIRSNDGPKPEWTWPDEWTYEWAREGDGVRLDCAHTWAEHGGAGLIHTEEDCPDKANIE